MKQTILVTGGAGYIGSHTVLELIMHNYQVVVIDRVCSFEINHPEITYFQCDIADTHAVKTILSHYKIDAVIHCAASIEVAESVINPAEYYENNVIKTLLLLDTLREHALTKLVFSSSAAVYGIPQQLPIKESHTCNPINPYGRTKYIIEKVLQDYHAAYKLDYIALRYFNAAGAYPEYNLGERHQPETHLIPRMLEAVLHNKPCTLFGTDYETPDGTCVRDYVHVRDIARAHRLALEYLLAAPLNVSSAIINLGTAKGFSIQEIITTVEQVTDKKLSIKRMPRRAGDPAYLIADNTLARSLLGWQALHSDITSIISSAYEFYIREAPKKNTLLHLKGYYEEKNN
ncbi:MAG: UDP-glucose 4-epimerase GalE [Candidatus Babeliaceae bacterium]|nr:UDP-glucose 4-epimerase GalE [Candidatus Babeliaceae bacterium]